MLKKIIGIILACFLTSCSASKSVEGRKLNEKFELCSKVKYEELIYKVVVDNSQKTVAENIHGLFENFLIVKGQLSDISISGYEELLIEIFEKREGFDDFQDFKKELGFDPLFLFASNYQASCYDYLIDQLKLVNSDSWYFKFREAFWRAEAAGFFEDSEQNILKALKLIPKENFNLLVYRKLFLDLIYWELGY